MICWPGYDTTGWGEIAMTVPMVLFVVVLALGAVLLFRALTPPAARPLGPRPSPEQLLPSGSPAVRSTRTSTWRWPATLNTNSPHTPEDPYSTVEAESASPTGSLVQGDPAVPVRGARSGPSTPRSPRMRCCPSPDSTSCTRTARSRWARRLREVTGSLGPAGCGRGPPGHPALDSAQGGSARPTSPSARRSSGWPTSWSRCNDGTPRSTSHIGGVSDAESRFLLDLLYSTATSGSCAASRARRRAARPERPLTPTTQARSPADGRATVRS